MSDLVGNTEDGSYHDWNYQEGFENLSCLEQCIIDTF